MTASDNTFRSLALFGLIATGLLSGVHCAPAQAAEDAAPASNPAATRFDDWFHRCATVKAANSEDIAQCEVVQVSQVKEGDKDVNVLTLAIAGMESEAGKKASSKDLMLTAVVPLNVMLPSGLGFAVDGRELDTLPFRNCNQAGCWAQLKLDGKMLRSLQKGASGEARLRMMNGQDVNLKFSLNGLSKALAELQKPTKV